MGPESIEFIEEVLDRHDIADEDIEFSTEWIAKEYSRQDGQLNSYLSFPVLMGVQRC